MQSGADSTPIPELSCKHSRIAVRDNDLTVLYAPPADSVIVDLIFVHGLQGHPRKTWQGTTEAPAKKRSLFGLPNRKRSREEYEESSDTVFWPADLLPDDYKNIRILTYGYDSHVSHYFKGPANKLNLSQLGVGLLNRVVGERRRSKVTGRPIVFVAHSLGGLLVKEALVESKKQGQDANKMDVYKSTQGIIFFGTPHKGSNDAKWGLIIKTIVSVAFDTNDKVLRALEPDSELLDKLARDFQDILDEGKLKICSLLESAGKAGLPIFNGKVVPDFSASFGSRKFEHQDYIERNHMNMCRFTGKEDAGYNRFRDGLEFCVEALEEIPTVENTMEGLLNSLKFDNMSAREAQLTNANAITLDWVWLLPAGRSSFAQWLSTKTGVFWIQGKPGSGKSTLMNYLKCHSQTKLCLAQASDQDWVIMRFFFDFRARNGVSNTFDGLLRSFLFQLALDVPELSLLIAEFGRVTMLQPKAQQELRWTAATLHEALLSALKTCTVNILMLIDGVDELEGAGRNMLDMIEFFQELASLDNTSRRIKICIASRPDPLIVTAFGASSGFKLQDYNDNGIENYINRRLKIAAQGPDNPAYFESRMLKFAELITKRSQGVFLWARFATDELLEGMANGDELEELWARLQALPDELEAIYARIINRTIQKCGGSQQTSVMLQIAYFTLRSLSVQEFFVIFQLSTRRQISYRSCSLAAFEKRLQAKTGGLVEVVGRTKREVKLIHETVRAYLDRLSGGSGRTFADSNNDPVFMEQFFLDDGSKPEGWSSTAPSQQANVFPSRITWNQPSSTTLNWLDASEHFPEVKLNHVAFEERPSLATVPDQLEASFPSIKDIFQPISVTESPLPANSIMIGDSLEVTNPRTVRCFSTPEKREHAAVTRRLVACIRCKMQRRRCVPDENNPEGACKTCLLVKSRRLSSRCFRYRLSSCLLSQISCTVLDWLELLQVNEHFNTTNQARAWKGKGSLTVEVNRYYGAPLKLSIREFVLEERSENSSLEFIGLNALGMESLGQATSAAKTCVKESLHACVSTKVDEDDQVAMICFQAALNMADHPEVSYSEFDKRDPFANTQAGKLFQNTLSLWVAARGLEDSWYISSAQVSNGWTDFENRVPLTPILRYQLETILQLQIIEPLRRKILEHLENMMLRNKRELWMTVFLTTFILLHNCDLIMAQHRALCPIRNTQEKGYFNEEHLRNIETAGNALLAHFHYIRGGNWLFSSDSRDRHQDYLFEQFDDETKNLILSLRAVIPEADKQMSRYLKPEEYEGKSWFRGQMFVSDWVPAPSIVGLGSSVESDSADGG